MNGLIMGIKVRDSCECAVSVHRSRECVCVCVHAGVLLDVYIFAGSVVIPECAINRCVVGCVGTQVLSPDHCIFHLCTHPSYDYQHMVSGTMNCKLLLLC